MLISAHEYAANIHRILLLCRTIRAELMAIWEKVNDSMRESNHYLLFSLLKRILTFAGPYHHASAITISCAALSSHSSAVLLHREKDINTSSLQWWMKWMKMWENVFTFQSLLGVPFKKYHSSKSAVRSKVITAYPAAGENTWTMTQKNKQSKNKHYLLCFHSVHFTYFGLEHWTLEHF